MSASTYKITIAIDGRSSCGKSTLAKALAAALGYAYVDSGAMYRAVTLFLLENDIDPRQPDAVGAALPGISIGFRRDAQGNRTLLNGRDVEEQIREMPVSQKVSHVAAIPAVRRAMVSLQQEMGKEKGIVMDGRDIGTVVFPEAELKIFLTASAEERTRRRYAELAAKGKETPVEAVRRNLEERDHIDSTRADSPLRKAEDAVVLDNTHLTPDEQLEAALELARKKIAEKRD